MAVVYKLLAADCPAIQIPSLLLDPAQRVPTTADVVNPGDIVWTPKFNANAVRLDLLGRFGGGGYAVATGLDIEEGDGLAATVKAGQIMLDGAITISLDQQIALVDDQLNYLWVTQLGTVVPVTGDPLPPADLDGLAAGYIGGVLTAAGAIVEVDYSGRLELRGGTLWRRTGDIGQPGDTPPAQTQFWSRTEGGLFWWDGHRYWGMSGGGGLDPNSITEIQGSFELTIAQGEAIEQFVDHLADQGFAFIGGADMPLALEVQSSHAGIRVTPIATTKSGRKTDGTGFGLLIENIDASVQ